jgi:hypothetical protein
MAVDAGLDKWDDNIFLDEGVSFSMLIYGASGGD